MEWCNKIEEEWGFRDREVERKEYSTDGKMVVVIYV